MVFPSFFRVFLRRYLSMKSFLICLLLPPVLVVGVVLVLDQEQSATSLTAGILVEDGGSYGQQVADALVNLNEITFVQYDDQEMMRLDVATGILASAYVLPDDFTLRVTNLEEELVELICLESDIYHQYINELVYTAVYTQMVPHITQEFLEERGISTDLEENVSGTQGYLAGDTLFEVDILSVQEVVTGEEGMTSPLPLVRGILTIALLLLTLMGAATAAAQQRGWALFAPHLGRVRCELYALAPVYTLGLLSGVVALALATFLSPYDINLREEIARLALYQLSLVAVGLVLPRLVGRDTIVLLIPFLLLFVLVTHPILLDVTQFFPQLKGILQWLPSYIYVG